MKIIILQLCWFIFLSPGLVWSADKIQGSLNTDVQLQDNDYIKILGPPQAVRRYIKTGGGIKVIDIPESDNEQINDALMKKYDLKEEEKSYSRNLVVFFQFLKPCTATSSSEDKFKDWKYFSELPRFRCDYRFKVFVTFFSPDGEEVETKGEYPAAYWTDSQHVERKPEMLPGEKSDLSFSIPADLFENKISENIYGKKKPPKSSRVSPWKAWVPK
jgi:hypothetical protein